VRSLRGQPLPDEHLETGGDALEGIALWHAGIVTCIVVQGRGTSVTNLLNIAALSRRTGVAPDTLRKWEQRYGVLRPRRTPGGQRRYTEHDVARVEWLRDRLKEGWRIGEASRVLEEAQGPGLADPQGLRQALSEATQESSGEEINAVLDQVFAVLPLEVAISEVIAPVLHWAGDEWAAGRLSVAQEHLLSGKVRARLNILLGDIRGGVRGTAVLACAPGEQHDLGLLMLAVMLRADGWRVEYLGQDTPVEEAVAFAETLSAALLCVSATQADTIESLGRALEGLERRPRAALVLGGAAVDAARAKSLGASYANSDLRRTVDRLRRFATG
jgi:methanogenic corrinoid protein MtbC1